MSSGVWGDMPPTDLHMIRALLSLPVGKLSTSEQSAFQAMFDQLATGRQVSLSVKQRAWVNSAFVTHRLDKGEQPPLKRIQVKDKSLIVSSLDTLKKPLKPPSRQG